jgi:spectinomycin phosphotransferase
VREPPPGLVDGEVLTIVRRHWPVDDVDEVEHLPVGFGAHHWRASVRGEPRLFVTLDALGARHSAASLEAAYAAAAALDLDLVVASLPTRTGRYTVPLEHARLSCAPWTEGKVAGSGPVADDRLAWANIDALARLHATKPAAAIPRWQPRVGPDFAASLACALRSSWGPGPTANRPGWRSRRRSWRSPTGPPGITNWSIRPPPCAGCQLTVNRTPAIN